MARLLKHRKGEVLLLLAIPWLAAFQSSRCAAQDFQRYVEYAAAISELNAEFALHRSNGAKLLEERHDTLQRIAATDKDIAELRANRDWHGYLLLENSLIQAATNFDSQMLMNQRSAPNTSNESRPATPILPDRETQAVGNLLANKASNLKVRGDALAHHIRTLNAAGHITVQRRFSLVTQLNAIINEMHQWNTESLKLFNDYWNLTDVAGVKCDIELRSALRELRKDATDNPGAKFAIAVTLLRLGDTAGTLTALDELSFVRPIRPLVLAARSEALFRQGIEREGILCTREAIKLARDDVRVRMHRAKAFEANGDLDAAEKEWEAVLKLGTQEIAARRALSTLNAVQPNPSKKQIAKAGEHATLASRLSAQQDWSCELAVALAAMANDDDLKAISLAEEARDLALGDKRDLCEQIIEEIKDGKPVSWTF